MRFFSTKTVKYSMFPFISELLSPPDNLSNATKTEKLSANEQEKVPETGWDRLRKMFQLDEFGNISHEVNSVMQTFYLGAVVGVLYGGLLGGKDAYNNFIRTNEATAFRSNFEAQRKLQDAVTIGFGKSAYRWGLKVSLFSSSFLGIVTAIQTYRGDYGIREYVCAGAVSGFIFRFNLGPRGWIVGSGLGAVLGAICGTATMGLLKLGGMTMEESRYWQYKWKDDREKYLKRGMQNYDDNLDLAVYKLHNDEVGESGKSLENLDKPAERKTIIIK